MWPGRSSDKVCLQDALPNAPNLMRNKPCGVLLSVSVERYVLWNLKLNEKEKGERGAGS